MLLQLKKIINQNLIDEASLNEALSNFKCEKDKDVQGFLKEKSIKFENEGQTATYILFNDEVSNDNNLQIDGYFSLALKVFSFSSDISNRQKSKISGKKDKEVPAYLIGQLARNDLAKKGIGKELINLAIQNIKNAQNYVGGRIVYLDCKDELISYYEEFGFKFIQKNINDDTLNQMYLII